LKASSKLLTNFIRAPQPTMPPYGFYFACSIFGTMAGGGVLFQQTKL